MSDPASALINAANPLRFAANRTASNLATKAPVPLDFRLADAPWILGLKRAPDVPHRAAAVSNPLIQGDRLANRAVAAPVGEFDLECKSAIRLRGTSSRLPPGEAGTDIVPLSVGRSR